MYRLIIIDDEPGAQEILAKYINKSQLGFEVLACLSDGEEALDYLEHHDVDVIITDIKMPRMTGIELAKILNETRPDIKVVIVSGYSEFEYAKKAIEFNVFNYILKPVDVDELIECLNTIRGVLDVEKQKDQYVAEMMFLQREQFFADLFMGALSDRDEISNTFKKLEFPFGIFDTKVEILRIELQNYAEFLNSRWHYGKEKLGMAIFNIIEKVVDGVFVYPVYHREERMEFILFIPNEYNSRIGTDMIVNEIKSVIELDTEINIIGSFDTLFELAESTTMEENEDQIIMLLISHIKSGNLAGAKNILNRFVNNTISRNISEDGAAILDNIAVKMVSYFDYNHTSVIELKQSFKNIQNTPENVLNMLTDNYLEEEDVVIHKAQLFMNDNYNKDISREDIADHVFLNSAYLGKYFKQKTGKTIYDYLLGIRMKKATELLTRNIKISEISERVGYNNYRQFLRVFKDYVGYTPKEYRQKVLKVEDY